MNTTDFKKRISEVIDISIEVEKQRFERISNKRLKSAGVDYKRITTDKEVKEAWCKFNKKEADWEKYCRKSKHEARLGKKSSCMDFSHLAYNGVTNDF